MTYYCPDWSRNLDPGDNQIDDGRPVERVYDEYRCTGFHANGTFYLNYHGEVIDQYLDDYADIYCSDHALVRQEDNDDLLDLAAEALSTRGFLICDECEEPTVWNTAEDWGDHRIDNHDDEDEEEDEAPHPAFLNVHTNWPQPTAP